MTFIEIYHRLVDRSVYSIIAPLFRIYAVIGIVDILEQIDSTIKLWRRLYLPQLLNPG